MPQRWIGRRGANDLALCAWPARFSDLSACDFFFVGYVKDKDYVPPLPENIDDIKDQITTAIKTVDYDMLRRVWKGFSYQLDIRTAGGAHIEHL